LFSHSQSGLVEYPAGKAGNYTIPNSVTWIGDVAFGGCAGLTSVTIPSSVTYIGDYTFYRSTSLTSVTIGANVTGIAPYMFGYCTNLTSVTIPNTVTSLGYYAFYYCTGLTNVTIPNGVTSIDVDAFGYCTNLTSVTIPSSVIYIGSGAFYNCSSLSSVMIPNSATNIGSSVFVGCTGLSEIMVDTRNPFYTSVDGVLFDKSQRTLISCPGGKAGIYTIPRSVTHIASEAFMICPNLTAICFQGNAPTVYLDFSGDTATIYYLPGTTGWGSTLGGLPAMLWNPQVQTGEASFGVRTNHFGFTITGTSNLVVLVEATSKLANPNWAPLATNTLTSGSCYFSDPEEATLPSRFYRLTPGGLPNVVPPPIPAPNPNRSPTEGAPPPE
jgi:hypothetical protein